MSQNEQDNRRKHPRIDRSFVARFRPYKGANYRGGWQISQIKNLSVGGCYLETDAEFKIGDILELELQMPIKGKQIRFHGEIVRIAIVGPDDRVKLRGLGISFWKTEQSKQAEFEEILRNCQRKKQ